MALRSVWIPDFVLVDESVDLHSHFRDPRSKEDGRMEMVLRNTVGHHAICVGIGNCSPAVLDQAGADRHLKDANACLMPTDDIMLLAAPLMRDDTKPEAVIETRIRNPRNVPFWKIFFHGVSNDGGNSVRNVRNIHDALKATYDPTISAPKMPNHAHAERKFDRNGRRIEMRDREWYCVDHDIRDILAQHPGIVLVLKHVSDHRTLSQIQIWRAEGYEIYAEICPQYLFRCHEDLYEAPGERPDNGTAFNLHDLCWPLYKDERSLKALREAVFSGVDWIVFGSDWACHVDDPMRSKSVKANDDGIVVGGVMFLAKYAKSKLISLFVDAGLIREDGTCPQLDSYLSGNARRIHAFPPTLRKVRYVYSPEKIPQTVESLAPGGRRVIRARVFMRGEQSDWHEAKAT